MYYAEPYTLHTKQIIRQQQKTFARLFLLHLFNNSQQNRNWLYFFAWASDVLAQIKKSSLNDQIILIYNNLHDIY